MNKSKIENVSDYAKLKDLLVEYSKQLVDFEKENKRLRSKAVKLEIAEDTLKQVQDLINSNEEICYFYTAKQEIRKPIEEYFKRRK